MRKPHGTPCTTAYNMKRHPSHMISQVYKNWESSFAILSEIFRNMGMAVVAVFVITLVMLSDLRLCLMVLTSIILTLVSQCDQM